MERRETGVAKVRDLISWLAGKEGERLGDRTRLYRTAVRRLAGSDLDLPLDELVETLDRRIRDLGSAEKITAASAEVYASRVRAAVRRFRSFRNADSVRPSARRRKDAIQAEINQALEALTHWPNLQPYLLPALAEAQRRLGGDGEGGEQEQT